MDKKIEEIACRVLDGQVIERKDAEYLFAVKEEEIYDVLYWANKIRFKYFGDNITLCAILSAKQGNCSEDCKFCAQSSSYGSNISSYPLVQAEKALDSVKEAENSGADSIGLVTSGYGLKDSQTATCDPEPGEFDDFCKLVENTVRESNIPIHASIGCMTEDMANRLVKCGVEKINHNLETSRNHFNNVCTTHTYDERLDTIKNAKKAGLKICSGGIFGIGESDADIIELALTLKELDVDTVPLNFLNPIPGTPLNNSLPTKPMDILKIIALFRFILPDKEIKLSGGRETNLRALQSWMFYAGANSTMIGNYLTTEGNPVEDDIQMIKDLGLTHTGNGNHVG